MQGQPQSADATKAIQVRLRKNLLFAIESWRRKQEIIPSRPEAIRRLLCKSLVDAGGLLAGGAAAETDERYPDHAA
jgi:hypothetical protein